MGDLANVFGYIKHWSRAKELIRLADNIYNPFRKCMLRGDFTQADIYNGVRWGTLKLNISIRWGTSKLNISIRWGTLKLNISNIYL